MEAKVDFNKSFTLFISALYRKFAILWCFEPIHEKAWQAKKHVIRSQLNGLTTNAKLEPTQV